MLEGAAGQTGRSRRGEAVYRLAAATGWCRLRRLRNRAPIFCFHNVVGSDPVHGERSLHVPVADFEGYACWIAHTYDVVPVAELVERAAAGRSVRGLAGITFDDAYVGVFRQAVPILRRLGLPATVFIVTEATSAPAPFWWDVLSTAGALSDEVRRRCLEEHHGEREACLAEGDAGGWKGGAELLPATWEVVAAAKGDVQLGSHTATHRNLTKLAPDDLERELVLSRATIEDRIPGAGALVSYPYGLIHEGVVRAAERAGYRGGVSLARGTLSPGDDRWALPRVNVPAGIGAAALECRAADIEPRRS